MENRKSYLLCFIAVTIFSTYEIIGKEFGNQIPAVSMTGIRFFIGGLFMLPMAIKEIKTNHRVTNNFFGKVTLIGILNVTISMVLLQLSVYYGTAILAAMIFCTNPIFVGIFSIFIEKEKLSKWNIIGLIIGLSGLILIAINGLSHYEDSHNMVLGIIFGILSGIIFAIYTVMSKIYVKEIGTFKLKSFAFLTGSIILFIIAWIFNLNVAFELNKGNILSLAYLGIIITGIGYFLYFEGLKNISTAKGAMFFYMKPVIVGFLAYIFLGETLTIFQMFGFVIVILGVNLEGLIELHRK